MKVPISWLKEYTDIDVDIKEFCDAMTMSGSKVEGFKSLGDEITGVVVGKIMKIKAHPDADRLIVAEVDTGDSVITVVTGADNISEGDLVPVALDGARLPGNVKIKKGKLRGVASEGMLCSLSELKLTVNDYPHAIEDGIFILEGDYTIGRDINEALGLDETVVEFEITSNRSDCFSVIGLAREAAATFGKEFKLKKPSPKAKLSENIEDLVSIRVEDRDLCPRYTARLVKDIKIGHSPEWMRRRLRDAGVRPINNIVDITNYVMLEYGQPMHAFDMDLLKGDKIVVRRAEDGEKIMTLDDKPRKLDSSMLVIADEERPVAVAGVMGGADSEVSGGTGTILFESANFERTSVRLTAQKLSMRTESSGRFEKGLDINNTIPAVERACELIEKLGAGKIVKGMIDICADIPKTEPIRLRPVKINEFLGTDIPVERMKSILESVDFKVEGDNVTAPSFRLDIECEADLAEEVARFYGYNEIKSTMPSGSASVLAGKTTEQKIRDAIEGVCLASGMYEIYTFSFASPDVFDRLGLKADDYRRSAVKIRNPLGEDFSIMRTTVLPDMLKVISHNGNRNVEKGAFYEMSHTYHPDENSELPLQKTVLTLGMFGNCDFYDLKGVTEEITDKLGIKDVKYKSFGEDPVYHPGRCAEIIANGERIGVIGQINPVLSETFAVDAETMIGTMEVEKLIALADEERFYTELPKFPAVERDIAIVVDDGVTVDDVTGVIRQSGVVNLADTKFFDMYKGAQIGEGNKSLAFSLVFRSKERTLREDEVNKSFEKIVEALKRELNAELR